MSPLTEVVALGSVAFSLAAHCAAAANETTGTAESAPDYFLSLQIEGTDLSTPDEYQRLYDLAMRLLKSSQFNSSKPLWNWDVANTLAKYRRAVNGRYLLVVYASPRTISTNGGDISVREIVIGLNRGDLVTSLHTVNGDGRIVDHAKYDGEVSVAILELIDSMERHLTTHSSGL